MVKRVKTCIDIVKRVEDKGIEYFEAKESRYHIANKFSPKKMPEAHILRSSIKPLYSYKVYARPEYYQHLKQKKRDAIEAAQKAKAVKCNSCGSPEGKKKHKVCSACKKVYYCSTDCQRVDWKKSHKAECKKMRA